MDHKPIGAGKSSYDFVDMERFFQKLDLRPDAVFCDLACGFGYYSLDASRIIENHGMIYAFDLWEEGLNALREEINRRKITNMVTQVVDIGQRIPLDGASVDVCLLATVLHDLIHEGRQDRTLRELGRILKPGGKLAVIEFKKIEGPPGPPIGMRISSNQVLSTVSPFGFREIETTEVGAFVYLSLFALGEESHPGNIKTN